MINELPIAQYIRGLGEVSNGDHPEKIKTILIAANTYARFYTQTRNKKFENVPYDGSDDPWVFQKYLGYSYELRSPNVTPVAQDVANTIITYEDAIIKPWYFNSSDGATKSYQQYCEQRG